MDQGLLLEVEAAVCVLCGKPGSDKMVDLELDQLTDPKVIHYNGRGGVHLRCLALEAMRLEDEANKFMAKIGHPNAGHVNFAGKYIRQAKRAEKGA